ncbi:MAG: 50S ribosomal protein L25 [Caulobacteraceae bacterium]
MRNVDLSASIRNESGNKQSKKLGREHKIPAILYEKETNGRLLKIDEKEINNVLSKNGENVVVKLKLGSDEVAAIIKEVQRDPVNNRLIHVDFQPVALHEIIHAEIPVLVINGERVERNGWVINKQMNGIEVEGEVEKIPPSIIVDASKTKIGEVFRVSDIEISEELSIVNSGEEVVLSILQAREQPVNLEFDRIEPELVTTEKEDKKKEKEK